MASHPSLKKGASGILKVLFVALVLFYLGRRGLLSAEATLGAFRQPTILQIGRAHV